MKTVSDWNADLVLNLISFLNVREAGNLAVQSRRFYYLVHQYRSLRGTELTASSSHEKGVRTRQLTAQQVCQKALEHRQTPPVLALGFGSWSSTLHERVSSHVPDDAIVLGAVAGSIQTALGDCDSTSHSALIMLGGFPSNVTIRPFCFMNEDLSSKGFESFFRSLNNGLDWKMIIVYACAEGVNEADRFVQTLQKVVPECNIVGGICETAYVSKPIEPTLTREQLNECTSAHLTHMNKLLGGPPLMEGLSKEDLVQHVLNVMQKKKYICNQLGGDQPGGICGVALAGSIPVRSVVSRGVRSLTSLRSGGNGQARPSSTFVVQDAQYYQPGDAHYMFQGGPSYHIIRNIKNEETGKEYTPIEMVRAFGQPDFLGIHSPGQDGFSLESPHPMSLNINSFLILSAESSHVGVGTQIDLFELSGEACMEDMDASMAKLKEQTQNEQVLGAIMFSCGGRGPSAGDLIPEEMSDAKRFAKIFPDVPLLGVYAGGEIGPRAIAGREGAFHNGNSCVQAFTAVFALLIVPKANVSSFSLDDRKELVESFIRSRIS
jgi:hypothetical protein